MDIEESNKIIKKELEPVEPVIRTMADDLAVLSDKEPITPIKQKKALAPKNLPVLSQSIKSDKKPLAKPVKDRPKTSFPKLTLISLIFILIIGAVGGFFYWWNYLRVVPAPASHSRCENNQCVVIEGQGQDQCLTDQDCQPVEPTLPVSIIPVSKTETITFNLQEKDKLPGQLKTIVNQEQATSTLNRVLIKMDNGQQREYLSLANLSAILKLNFPEKVLSMIAVDEVQADNYTLFSSSQAQGNHLGLVLELQQGVDLIEDLKIWEDTIKYDLEPLFLEEQIPASLTEEFQDNAYRNIAIRYMNFPGPDLSIDYALAANKLVITTSRESMYAAIDVLLGD
ncbi:MAG: hypothetical protein CMI55_01720 [Parcubacteria group bacterium]|jgi:hypothetical protein|nr:hypothetical protein [Parcubacteria group bacterium]|tara:strand:- start:16134 stop:17153 length:1020 start_codon:yes stop_codon:yes gene_type:complete